MKERDTFSFLHLSRYLIERMIDMIFFFEAQLSKEEIAHREEKLIHEVYIKFYKNHGNDFTMIPEINNHDSLYQTMELITFLVEELLPKTRWASNSHLQRYSDNSTLVEWFSEIVVKTIMIKIKKNQVSIKDAVDTLKLMKYEDPDKFNRDIIFKFTGYQTFTNSLSYPYFIPGVSHPDYQMLNPDYQKHDVQSFFVGRMREFLNFYLRHAICKTNDDQSSDEIIPTNFTYNQLASYIRSFNYPDKYGWLQQSKFSFNDLPKDQEDIVVEQKMEYFVWMAQEVLKYFIDRTPNHIRYKTKPGKYKNKVLRNTIIDSLYVKGLGFNMKKNKEVRTAICNTLDLYYDKY